MGIENVEIIISIFKLLQCILAGVFLYFAYKKKKERTLKYNRTIIVLSIVLIINLLLIKFVLPVPNVQN